MGIEKGRNDGISGKKVGKKRRGNWHMWHLAGCHHLSVDFSIRARALLFCHSGERPP
jgi:hypothetical protein